MGKLKVSQMNVMLDGYVSLKKQEADQIKQSSGNRKSANTLTDVAKIPGMVVANKKKC